MATSPPAGRAVPLRVDLDRASGIPLAAQLARALRQAAVAGRLRDGDRLPSTRALAACLRVSRTVTSAAYDELHAEGWLRTRTGSGTFVAARAPASIAVRPGAPGPGPARPGVPKTELLDVSPGLPWLAGIDRAAWRRAWRRAADLAPADRRLPAGSPGYRRCVAEHLLFHRGLVVAQPERDGDGVLATAGTSAAIGELAVAVFRPGEQVAIEEPGYGRAVASLRAAGVVVVPVPVDEHGLVPAAVPEHVRAVYCSPAHQYPLGARMPVPRRVELVERARRHGWLIVEDDYDGELRFDVAPPPVLAALAPDVVIHLGTTSKILSPSLACGWMVAPHDVTVRVLDHRRRTSVAPGLPGQHMLVEFARTGDLGRHLRRVRRELSARRELLVGLLAGIGIQAPGVDAGAHLVVPLPDAVTERAALDAGAGAGLRLDQLSRHYHGARPGYGLVIGYTIGERAQVTSVGETLCALLAPLAPRPWLRTTT